VRAAVVASREITGTTGRGVVAHNANASNAVMQPFEARAFELSKTCGDDATQLRQDSTELQTEADVQTMRHQMSTTETLGVGNQLIHREAHRGIVRSDDGSCARAYDDVDGYTVSAEPLQDADVRSTPQTSTAEDKTNTNWRLHVASRVSAEVMVHSVNWRRQACAHENT
jgi:hypothetical protein